jgi:hypothetical protein
MRRPPSPLASRDSVLVGQKPQCKIVRDGRVGLSGDQEFPSASVCGRPAPLARWHSGGKAEAQRRRGSDVSAANSTKARNGLRRHPDLPRVWVSNPIEYLSTEEVWAYLLQKPNPWGNDNRTLYKLYANASNGECPIQIDTSTPSCGHSRFGCWTCTSVERDKPSPTRRRCSLRQPSEGLLAAGDQLQEAVLVHN